MSEELTAGPALDALVAEKVMGWGFAPFELDIRDWRAPDGSLHAEVPAYSTDMAAAWQVLQRFDWWSFGRGTIGETTARIRVYDSQASDRFHEHGACVLSPELLPQAICRAALAAVTYTADTEQELRHGRWRAVQYADWITPTSIFSEASHE